MPKDLDQISKQIDKNTKELLDNDKALSRELIELYKNNLKLSKEIADIKKEVANIAFKVDTMLEILNNFTIMLAEDDEDLEENYEYEGDHTWLPKEDEEFWEDDENEEA